MSTALRALVSALAAAPLLVGMLALSNCGDDEPSALSLLGGGCRLNSDCSGGLVCAYGVCHQECGTSKDCDDGRCVLGPGKVHLCQPASTAACTFNSDCIEPLTCARDAQCRNQCASDRDCVDGQQCVSATCAEPDELDESGKLPPVGDPVGKPCNYASDCESTADGLQLVCRSGVCGYACFEDRDCGKYRRCSSTEADVPGNCDLIGDADNLFCDPLYDAELLCPLCPGAPTSVPCKEDGSGYEVCCP